MVISGVLLFVAIPLRVVGATSILLWSTVGWGGRWIGFS